MPRNYTRRGAVLRVLIDATARQRLQRWKIQGCNRQIAELMKMGNVYVSLGIPLELLSEIEANIEAPDRNKKLVKCITEGYNSLSKREPAATTESSGSISR
jgi:hypothetical protein